tara:strand:- start:36 stop:617 length:582 start_codon:yes stop_codon:yes gene_type:complete
MIKEQFFPTIIYGKDVKLNNQLFANEIVEWSRRDPGVKKTNRNGWHSTTEMHKIPVFKPLIDELFIMMEDIWQEEWLDKEPILGNMWANINPPGGYNRPHVHPNSHFSGVYYIKAPQNSGQIVFNEPRLGAHMVMPSRKKGRPPKHLWREVQLDPIEGRILIFPSWLWHNVEPNLSNDIRISVSFNFIQYGFQ